MSFAMALWEQADIEAALGAKLAEALPELLRLADLEVRMPRMEVVALEAGGTGWNASRYGSGARVARLEWLAKEIPGLRGGAGVAVLKKPIRR